MILLLSEYFRGGIELLFDGMVWNAVYWKFKQMETSA